MFFIEQEFIGQEAKVPKVDSHLSYPPGFKKPTHPKEGEKCLGVVRLVVLLSVVDLW